MDRSEWSPLSQCLGVYDVAWPNWLRHLSLAHLIIHQSRKAYIACRTGGCDIKWMLPSHYNSGFPAARFLRNYIYLVRTASVNFFSSLPSFGCSKVTKITKPSGVQLQSTDTMGLSIITAYTGSSMEFVGISLFTAILCLYATVVVTYRVTFHPLSQFPGPMLARASYGYEFWFDVVHKGQFTRKVAELHKVYGNLPQNQSIVTFFITMYTFQAPLYGLIRMSCTAMTLLSSTSYTGKERKSATNLAII